jgi:hypothetical protein
MACPFVDPETVQPRYLGLNDRDFNSFVQAYGSKRLDAGLLLIPMVGFLPPEDPRVRGTLRAIEDRLLIDGEFVLRYETEHAGDGLPTGAGVFPGVQLLARRQLHIAVPLCGSGKLLGGCWALFGAASAPVPVGNLPISEETSGLR